MFNSYLSRNTENFFQIDGYIFEFPSLQFNFFFKVQNKP